MKRKLVSVAFLALVVFLFSGCGDEFLGRSLTDEYGVYFLIEPQAYGEGNNLVVSTPNFRVCVPTGTGSYNKAEFYWEGELLETSNKTPACFVHNTGGEFYIKVGEYTTGRINIRQADNNGPVIKEVKKINATTTQYRIEAGSGLSAVYLQTLVPTDGEVVPCGGNDTSCFLLLTRPNVSGKGAIVAKDNLGRVSFLEVAYGSWGPLVEVWRICIQISGLVISFLILVIILAYLFRRYSRRAVMDSPGLEDY